MLEDYTFLFSDGCEVFSEILFFLVWPNYWTLLRRSLQRKKVLLRRKAKRNLDDSLSQWLTFRLLEITYLVGKIEFIFFISWSEMAE